MRSLRWLAIALLVALVMLGLWGTAVGPVADAPAARLYRVLQLFFVEGDWTYAVDPLPWQIQLVRFVAPVFLAAGLVLLFVQGALTELHNATVRFARGHIVVVGINELSLPFLRSCRDAGRDVVVVASGAGQEAITEVRNMGLRVLAGNALDAKILRRAGIAHASNLVAFDADGVNVELALRARHQLRAARPGRAPLKLRLHLTDTRLGERLEEYPKFFDDAGVAQVSFFNVGERTAHRLLWHHPLEACADVLGLERVHVVLFGFNDVARHVVLEIARLGHFADGQIPRLSIIDSTASDAYGRMLAEYPQLSAACDVECIDIDLSREYVVREIAGALTRVSAYLVARADDIRSVEFSLHLRRELLAGFGLNAPILVHTRKGGGIARLLEAEAELEGEIPDGLYPFGELSEVLSVESVVDERTDELARSIHEHYLAQAGERVRLSQADWLTLPEAYRRENRISAAHVEIKLRALGLRVVPARARPALSLTAEAIELFARMEQQRWLAGQLVRGWQHGPRRAEKARTSRRMLRWAELPEQARDDDRQLVRDLVRIVRERQGLDVARDVSIGLCVLDESFDEAGLENRLTQIERRYPGCVFTVMSTVRYPAERRFVSMAKERLGANSLVYLPLPDDLYLLDLSMCDAAAVRASRQAVGAAAHYFELPFRFGSHDVLASDPAARAKQVALAQAYIVRRADELIVVGEGPGRTLIEAWRAGDVASEYRFPGQFFPRIRPRADAALSRTGGPADAYSNTPSSR